MPDKEQARGQGAFNVAFMFLLMLVVILAWTLVGEPDIRAGIVHWLSDGGLFRH